MKLVVGLGNPGKEYEHTRHNVGFRVLDSLRMPFRIEKKFGGVFVKQNGAIYLKPQTFMNESGRAVRAVMDFYHIPSADVIVVYDDKDLPFGTIRLRASGSSAGHNGIKSIIQHLGTENFSRVRVGILGVRHPKNTARYVLSPFSKDQETQMSALVREAAAAIDDILAHGLTTSQHRDIPIS